MTFNYFLLLLSGVKITLALALLALLLGLTLGLVGAMAEFSRHKLIRYFFISYHSIIRGVPELLVIFFVYFGSSQVLNLFFTHPINVNPFAAGFIALGLLFGAYASQTIRGAFLTIHASQIDSGRALALTKWQTFYLIKLPQAWRYALPGLSNLWLVLLKDTALVSLIGCSELMMQTQAAAITTQQPFIFYAVAALIYLALTSISEGVFYWCHRSSTHT